MRVVRRKTGSAVSAPRGPLVRPEKVQLSCKNIYRTTTGVGSANFAWLAWSVCERNGIISTVEIDNSWGGPYRGPPHKGPTRGEGEESGNVGQSLGPLVLAQIKQVRRDGTVGILARLAKALDVRMAELVVE